MVLFPTDLETVIAMYFEVPIGAVVLFSCLKMGDLQIASIDPKHDPILQCFCVEKSFSSLSSCDTVTSLVHVGVQISGPPNLTPAAALAPGHR